MCLGTPSDTFALLICSYTANLFIANSLISNITEMYKCCMEMRGVVKERYRGWCTLLGQSEWLTNVLVGNVQVESGNIIM